MLVLPSSLYILCQYIVPAGLFLAGGVTLYFYGIHGPCKPRARRRRVIGWLFLTLGTAMVAIIRNLQTTGSSMDPSMSIGMVTTLIFGFLALGGLALRDFFLSLKELEQDMDRALYESIHRLTQENARAGGEEKKELEN